MKTRWLPVTAVLLTLLASACSSGKVAPDETTTLSEIYTAVAITVAARANVATSTVASVPTGTLMPIPTMGLVNTATPTTTVSYASYAASSSCNSSAYISDVTIDDGTELAPRESLTKTWELANNGSCNWSKHYSVAFVSGDDMNGDDTEIDQKVEAGETAEVSVDLTAPDDEGTYTGYWSLADASGNLFGQKVYVEIVVSEDAATSTPTETPTPTATATSVTSTGTPTSVPATATNTATATPTPSATPTIEATPTETSGS